VGSRPGGRERGGADDESKVRIVWSGKVGSHESIQWAVGSKPPGVGDIKVVAWVLRLFVLF